MRTCVFLQQTIISWIARARVYAPLDRRLMKTILTVVVAYLITGAHFVWRDSHEQSIRQPAYARSRNPFGLVLPAFTWLFVTLAMPTMIGWYWRGLKRYVFSLLLFAWLIGVGLFFG
jgi:hypothetical protein